jgi:hypothetical protein
VVAPATAGSFQAAVNYHVGSSPLSVVAGDLNGDGKTDLVVANRDSGNVSVLLGSGAGTFAPAVNYTAGLLPTSVALGDFNGDGNLDVAVSSASSNTVVILLGNGNGTLQPPGAGFAVGRLPLFLAAGDFNGDGMIDLATANNTDGTVSVLLGNGDGTFQTALTLTIAPGCNALAIADFNGDGYADMAVTNDVSNTVSVLLGRGDGTFQPAVAYWSGTSPSGWIPVSVVAADFNGDGKPDLAVVNYGTAVFSGNVQVLLNRGNGTFQTSNGYGTGVHPTAVVAADFNGDGATDLAVMNSSDNTISVFLGRENGYFTNVRVLTYNVDNFPSAGAVADFNGDGRADLAVANANAGNVSVLLGGAPPLMSCSPSQITFTVTTPSQDNLSQTCSVTSSPTGLYLMEFATSSGGNWLTAGVNSMQTPATLTAFASALSLLAPGSYNGNIEVWDQGSGARINIPVTLSIAQSVCQYSLSPTSAVLPAGGGSDYFLVTNLNYRGCSWTPVSDSSWLTVTPTTPTTGSGWVQYTATANAGGSQRTATVTAGGQSFTLTQAGVALQPVSVSPASGSGSAQTFTFQFADASGPTGAAAQMWFTQAYGTDRTTSCLMYYASNQLFLVGDDGVTTTSATLGASGSLANHQCSVDTGSATAVWSGGNVTITMTVTFLPSFAAPLQTWMDIYTPTADSGWFQEGSWTVTAPPDIVSVFSVTPCCEGHGANQNFVFKYADTSGGGNIQTAWAWFTPAYNSGNAAHTCQIYYNVPLHQWNLLDDSGTTWMSATTGGVTLRNSQCSFFTGSASGVSSGLGNYFQLTINQLSFTPAFSGLQQIWGYATASITNNSGWRQVGSFTVGSPIQVSLQPNAGSGAQQIFQVTVSDPSGSIRFVDLLINSTTNAANACYLHIDTNTGPPTIYLVSDDGLSYAGSGSMGSSLPSPQNTQCIVNLVDSSAASDSKNPGTEIFAIGLSFKPPFSGAKNIYAGTADAVWNMPLQQYGTWTVAGVPPNVVQAVSVTPSSGQGTSTYSTFLYSDADGSGDFTSVQALFNTSASSSGGCSILVNTYSRTLQLADDSGSAWLGPILLSSVSTVQNSQCVVSGASTASAGGNNFTLNLFISFKPAFAGVKNVYGSATGTGNVTSGWQLLGIWGTANSVPSNVSVSPGTGSGSRGTFAFTFADTGGIAHLSSVWMQFGTPRNPAGGDSNPPNTCFITYNPALNILALNDDTGLLGYSGHPGDATSIFNSQCSLDLSQSSAAAGSNLVVTIAIRFRPAYTGNRGIWMQAMDDAGGGITGMQQEGSWIVSFAADTISLNAAPSPSILGKPVTLTTTVSPSTATGLVTFFDGATVLGEAPLSSGTAALATILLPAGTRSLRAYYGGDATYGPNISAVVTQAVNANPGTTFVAASRGPFATGAAPDSVAQGDFNGDGLVDLAVANYHDNSITVLLGSASGAFTAAPGSPFAAGTNPASVAVADFNGDGKADLAIANSGSGNITVLLGNGSGGFTAASSSPIAVGAQLSCVKAGDFNGDGYVDLIVANPLSNSVTVLLGNGRGGFMAPGGPIDVGNSPASLVVGDFNGDGIPDLAVANENSNSVTILLGDGSGRFAAAPVSPPTGSSPISIVIGDFNGDGNADLAVANYIDNNVTVLLGDGRGGFTKASGSPFSVGFGPTSLAVGDFNGDGKADLAVTSDPNANVTVLSGNGSGGFSPMSGSPFPAGMFPRGLVVGDFNGDGRADLAVADFGSNSIRVLLGTESLVVSGPASLPAGALSATYPATTITAADGNVPYTWSATGLPPGLSIGPATGTISGTPTTTTGSPFTVTITVTDSASLTASKVYSLTVSNAGTATYKVGDVAPFTADVAPNFGDGNLNILDLVQILFAVNNVPGFRPAPCSDRFDAMDLFPVDTGTTCGGDGVLDIRDLIRDLFRVNNLDPDRPVRASRGGVCPGIANRVGGSPTAANRSSEFVAAQGVLLLGNPEKSGTAQERVPVYLEAGRDLVRVAVTFALGDQRSQLRFVTTPDTPRSLAQDSQLGVVAVAWLEGVTVRAGERLLLGYVAGPAGASANLKVFGISGSRLDDSQEVRLNAPATIRPER